VVTSSRDAVDEQIAAAVGADVAHLTDAKVSCCRCLTTMIEPSPPRLGRHRKRLRVLAFTQSRSALTARALSTRRCLG
jgi:hypothetical protein